MIVFERFGFIFRIRDYDWKALRKRYDVKNAKYNPAWNEWKIKKDCTICLRYETCRDCPFGCLGKIGCLTFFNKIFRKPKLDSSGTDSVMWENKNNTSARRQLKRLNEIMDEIERENKKENQHEMA